MCKYASVLFSALQYTHSSQHSSIMYDRLGVSHEQVSAVVDPVDDVEDEEEDGHGHQEEAVHVDVVLAAEVPRRLLGVNLSTSLNSHINNLFGDIKTLL
jgi:hypothetical protein